MVQPASCAPHCVQQHVHGVRVFGRPPLHGTAGGSLCVGPHAASVACHGATRAVGQGGPVAAICGVASCENDAAVATWVPLAVFRCAVECFASLVWCTSPMNSTRYAFDVHGSIDIYTREPASTLHGDGTTEVQGGTRPRRLPTDAPIRSTTTHRSALDPPATPRPRPNNQCSTG